MILGMSEKVGAQVVASDTAAGGALDVWNALKRNTPFFEPFVNRCWRDTNLFRQKRLCDRGRQLVHEGI